MPIKFHCHHCGMYLGISRTKIGTVVDCPACGRSVRVPQKDGEAERVGRPSLNHEDSQLANALREVAAIAQSSSMAMPQLPLEDHRNDGRETREVRALPPIVVPAEPQPSAKAIEPAALPNLQKVASDGMAHGPREHAYDPRGAMEDLASLADDDSLDEPANAFAASAQRKAPWANVITWQLWLAFVVVGVVAIVTGFTVGRWDGVRQPATNSGPQSQSLESQNPEYFAELGDVAITGTVKSTAEKPMQDVWVYAFPETRLGAEKIPADWLAEAEPKDYQSGHQLVVAALRAMGGNAAQTGSDGKFALRLAREGNYQLLLCSPRINGNSNSAKLTNLLSQFFADPDAFLDRRQFEHLESVEYEGEPKIISSKTLDP